MVAGAVKVLLMLSRLLIGGYSHFLWLLMKMRLPDASSCSSSLLGVSSSTPRFFPMKVRLFIIVVAAALGSMISPIFNFVLEGIRAAYSLVIAVAPCSALLIFMTFLRENGVVWWLKL